MMQASFAIAGGLFGVVAFSAPSSGRWLLGAAVLLVNWPYMSTPERKCIGVPE
jgi:hypothetical protein